MYRKRFHCEPEHPLEVPTPRANANTPEVPPGKWFIILHIALQCLTWRFLQGNTLNLVWVEEGEGEEDIFFFSVEKRAWLHTMPSGLWDGNAMFTCSSDYVFYDLQRNVFVADFTNCSPFVHLFVELGWLFLHFFLGQAIVKPGIRYMCNFAFSTGSKSQWIWRRYSSDVGILQRIYINRIAWCLRLKNSSNKLGNEDSSQNRDNIRPVSGEKRRGEFHNHFEPDRDESN